MITKKKLFTKLTNATNKVENASIDFHFQIVILLKSNQFHEKLCTNFTNLDFRLNMQCPTLVEKKSNPSRKFAQFFQKKNLGGIGQIFSRDWTSFPLVLLQYTFIHMKSLHEHPKNKIFILVFLYIEVYNEIKTNQ